MKLYIIHVYGKTIWKNNSTELMLANYRRIRLVKSPRSVFNFSIS